MEKIASFILALLMIFSLCACGENTTEPAGTESTGEVQYAEWVYNGRVGELHTEPTKAIGADTEAVLKEYGYTDAQLASMKAAGIIN